MDEYAGGVVGEGNIDSVGVHGDVVLSKALVDGVDHGSRGWGADAHRVDRREPGAGDVGVDCGISTERVGLTFEIHFGDVDFGVASALGDLGEDEDEVPMVDHLGVGGLRILLLLLGL
eukprot:scaffold10966_cov127-Isochrysis_galbana.AAC.1